MTPRQPQKNDSRFRIILQNNLVGYGHIKSSNLHMTHRTCRSGMVPSWASSAGAGSCRGIEKPYWTLDTCRRPPYVWIWPRRAHGAGTDPCVGRESPWGAIAANIWHSERTVCVVRAWGAAVDIITDVLGDASTIRAVVVGSNLTRSRPRSRRGLCARWRAYLNWEWAGDASSGASGWRIWALRTRRAGAGACGPVQA